MLCVFVRTVIYGYAVCACDVLIFICMPEMRAFIIIAFGRVKSRHTIYSGQPPTHTHTHSLTHSQKNEPHNPSQPSRAYENARVREPNKDLVTHIRCVHTPANRYARPGSGGFISCAFFFLFIPRFIFTFGRPRIRCAQCAALSIQIDQIVFKSRRRACFIENNCIARL